MTPTKTRSCMGGFCHFRDACALHTTDARWNPVERICRPGAEMPQVVPIEGQAPWRAAAEPGSRAHLPGAAR